MQRARSVDTQCTRPQGRATYLFDGSSLQHLRQLRASRAGECDFSPSIYLITKKIPKKKKKNFSQEVSLRLLPTPGPFRLGQPDLNCERPGRCNATPSDFSPMLFRPERRRLSRRTITTSSTRTAANWARCTRRVATFSPSTPFPSRPRSCSRRQTRYRVVSHHDRAQRARCDADCGSCSPSHQPDLTSPSSSRFSRRRILASSFPPSALSLSPRPFSCLHYAQCVFCDYAALFHAYLLLTQVITPNPLSLPAFFSPHPHHRMTSPCSTSSTAATVRGNSRGPPPSCRSSRVCPSSR